MMMCDQKTKVSTVSALYLTWLWTSVMTGWPRWCSLIHKISASLPCLSFRIRRWADTARSAPVGLHVILVGPPFPRPSSRQGAALQAASRCSWHPGRRGGPMDSGWGEQSCYGALGKNALNCWKSLLGTESSVSHLRSTFERKGRHGFEEIKEVQLFCPPLPIPVLHGHWSWVHLGRGAKPLVPHHRPNLRTYRCINISALHPVSSCPKQHLLWEGTCPQGILCPHGLCPVTTWSCVLTAEQLCAAHLFTQSHRWSYVYFMSTLCIFLKWIRSRYVQDAVQRENRSDFNINPPYDIGFY